MAAPSLSLKNKKQKTRAVTYHWPAVSLLLVALLNKGRLYYVNAAA